MPGKERTLRRRNNVTGASSSTVEQRKESWQWAGEYRFVVERGKQNIGDFPGLLVLSFLFVSGVWQGPDCCGREEERRWPLERRQRNVERRKRNEEIRGQSIRFARKIEREKLSFVLVHSLFGIDRVIDRSGVGCQFFSWRGYTLGRLGYSPLCCGSWSDLKGVWKGRDEGERAQLVGQSEV
ncbi:hypothetical protein R1flu_011147 [Riccia fluitans]|uniref:Uncharacterized protein n=1 Tax=Riccia fluitans TaxID=41844 RepID=A0ABD1Z6Z8_9MARC